jgi:hypothetical protein
MQRKSVTCILRRKHADTDSIIEEIDDLHVAMARMKQTLIKFISMGSMLSVKNDFTQQMQGLLTETTEIADMTGGHGVFIESGCDAFHTPVAFVGARKYRFLGHSAPGRRP